MKSVFSHLTVILLFLMVSVSPVSAQYDLFGYGRNATGGGNATPILVDTEEKLLEALSGKKSDRVVIITANITVSTQFTAKGSNITLLALPGRCLISNGQSSEQSGILNMRGSNIIIRNVTFIGPGAYDCDGKDLLQFEDATNAWVDHCDFQDGCDGNFDIKSNSDNITVTWCRFCYLKPAKSGGSGGAADHRFTNLLGQSSSAKPTDGTYNVSYAYNWWDNGCKERMVRCRNCEIHFFNCYWNSDVANYYVGPENATCYFEGCTFAGKANSPEKIFKPYNDTQNNCKFVNSVGNLPSNQGTVNTPSYSYFVESASDAVASITDANCGAGATLVVETDGSITTCGANLTKYTVTFNLNGKGTNFTQEVYENRTMAAPATPTTSGFVFDGWYTEAQCTNAFNFSTPITANRILYAKWVQAMTVTFNLNGKGTNFTQEVVSGGKASVPSNPTAAGYIFVGWYSDQACTSEYDFNTTITAAKTIYAKWEKTNYCYEFTPATSGEAPVVGSVIAGNANSGGTMTVSSLKQAGSISYESNGLKFSSGSADKVTVTLDNYLQAGSIISLTLVSGGSSDERGLDILDANGKDVSELVWEVSASGEERTLSYEVTNDDNLVGTKVFQLQRHNSIYLKNITVGNCGGTSLPTYTITYKANGGTGDDIVAAETMTVANCTFTAPTGYEFSGWNTAADGSGTDYAVGRAINADVTLYAQWTIHSYTVHFDMQGHGSAISNQIVNYGAKVNEPNKPAVLDYTFGGWYKEAACTNAWNFETDVVTSEITLYAKWEELSNCADETVYDFSTQDEFTTGWDVVKASYDCAVQTSDYNGISPINGGMLGVGLSSPGSVTITTKAYYTNITNIVLKLASTDTNNPEITVSVVNGSTVTDLFTVTPKKASIIAATSNKVWGTHSQELNNLSGKIRIVFNSTSNAKYATIDDVKICGQETALSTYTVRYALNGGEGTAPTQAATTAGSTFTLASADGITKDGYTFAGWNDGTTTYAAGATYTMPANNITLTAQWTENVVTPDPTPGGGGGSSIHYPGVYETTYGQTLTTFDGRKYEIYGFSSSSSDQNFIWAGTTTVDASSSNCILSFATTKVQTKEWVSNNVNGRGSPLEKVTKEEFSLNGYSMNYRNGHALTIRVCGFDQFSIYAKDNNATSSNNKHFVVTIDGVDVTKDLSTSETIRRYDLTTTEHTIVVSGLGSSNNVLNGFSLRVAETTPPASQTAITLSPQGGTGGTTEVTATKDEAMPEITIPTRAGYDFQGYFTANGGTGTKYYNADGTSAKNWDKEDATFTLVAYWTAKTYTVTLDANGGNGGTESVTATYNDAMPSITPATLAGYALTGYFDAASGGTKYYNADGTSAKNWDKTSATTLYAQWECTAPTDLTISGEYIHFPGETLTLTVSGNNIAADATYTWKKGGQVIAGQTTATLTINNCTASDAGNYVCEVTNGTCTATNNYTVKMYSLRGLIDWSTDCVFNKSIGTTATYSMELAAGSYEFKIFDGSAFYGNEEQNPTMTAGNCTGWVMKENSGNNVTLQTTVSGIYVFTLDYEDPSNPEISVTYPTKRIVYLEPGVWYTGENKEKFVVHAWYGSGVQDILMTKIDDCADRNIYQAEIDANHEQVIFIRVNPAGLNLNNPWSNEWNRTKDLTLISENQFTISNWGGTGEWNNSTEKSNGAWTSFTPNYSVTFNANGHGTAPEAQCVAKNGKATQPTAPTATGYTFGGWYKEAGCTNAYDFNTEVTSDIILYAKWTVNTYQITYKEEDRTTTIEGLEPTTYTYGVGVAELPTPSEKIGYTFDSWYSEYCIFEDEEGVNNPGHGWVDDCKRTSIATTDYGNVTFLAKYTANTYTVTFNTNEGTINAGEINSYTFGVGATLPTDVTKENYTFLGWFDNEGLTGTAVTTIPTNATGNKTYWAKWEENTPVTPEPEPEEGTCWNISDEAFKSLSGDIKENKTVNGLNIVATSEKPITVEGNPQECDGYTFTHRLKFNGTGNKDYRHLKFAVTGACTIDVYLMSGNSKEERTLNVAIGSFGTNVTERVAGTTIAKQTYEYTGSATDIYMYSANSGINIYQICVTYPTTPTPDPGTQYTVTFDANGHGTAPAAQTVAGGGTITEPTAPTAQDYVFFGWYTDQACTTAFNFSTPITANTTLYAKWNEMDILMEDRCWNISEFETDTITAPQTINQLHIVATLDEEIIIDENTRKIDSISFTNRLKYGGKGSLTTRNLWFSVKGDCRVDIYMMSANNQQTRHLGVATGSFTNVVATFDASPELAKVTYEYTGDPTTIFLYPTDNGLNIYQICVTYLLPPCPTPELSSLTNQIICEGEDAEAWTAAITNTNDLVDGEIVSYQWTKRGNATILSENATYQLNDVTEAMGGTYVLTAIVSADGKSSATASTEVTLTVIPATEVPTITTDKQKVYTGNSVTLTATTGTPTGVTYQWYTCDDAEGTNATEIEGATNNAYTLASAGDAGTYYYKVIVTGDGTHSCGTAEAIFPLVVSTPSACETFVWYNNGVQPERFEFASKPKGTNEINASMTIDGVTYTNTYRSGDWNSTLTFTIEENHVATFYIYAKSSGSSARTLTLKDDMQSNTTTLSVDDYDTYASTELTAGTWTLTSSGKIHISMIGLLVCSTAPCTDPEVTATVDNAVICASNDATVTFTANNAADGATFQWQKHNGTSWENISGATNATYTINPVAAENTGKYRVIAEAGCKRISNELTLTVLGTPVFNTFNTTQSVMTRSPLSISDVQATNATGYTWYKSADATFNSAEDTQIGNTQDLMISSVAETAGSTFYLFCVASNSCGSVTSNAITVTVTPFIAEECATKGNEGDNEFGFTNTDCGQETYESRSAWKSNGSSKYLTYTAPADRYFATAKVTVAHTKANNAVYGYSTDKGTTWTYVEFNGLSTAYTTITIELPGKANAFRIGRNMDRKGESLGSFYLAEACFTYENACTETTLTVGSYENAYNLSVQMDFVEPTFTLKSGETTLTPAEGAITYSSSDVAIVTVDENGNLIFTGMTGTVTITATYAGGTIDEVDYCACQGSYTITVGCKDAAPKIFAAAGTNLDGCNASITLEAKMQDGTYFAEGSFQWYRDGVAIEGATGTSYEVVLAGTYTVWRTNTCTLVSTNSAVVTNENQEPKVERLTPFQYYHADKNYSAQMKDRHLFAVTSYGTYEGKRYHLTATRNGETVDVSTSTAFSVITSQDNVVDTVMIDLNQLKGKYSEGDEIVITCTAVNSCNELSVINNSITIHVIDKTPVLALICSGAKADGTGTRVTAELTVGGDFLTGYNPADLCQQTTHTTFDPNTEWGFYTELKKNYIVVPVNGYAQFNKLNYEPFDVLLLTDYPKSSHSEVAQKIIDDMAELCDYRPLLSFKTHFQSANWAVNGESKYNKWTKKGFVTAPVVPATTATYVNIVCYAHPMFEEIQAVQGEGSIAFHDYDDKNQLVYEMLTGPGYENNKGIQGFELADASSFVTIGLVHYNATATKVEVEEGGEDHEGDGEGHHAHVQWTSGENDRLLVAIAERQANIEARMILFSINCGAQSLQTEGGRQVILECLQYLYDPDNDDPQLIEVADCYLTFDNGAGNIDFNEEHYREHGGTGTKGDGLWTTAANWAPKYDFYPSANNEVRIAAECTINNPTAAAFSVQIVEEGKITINPGNALTVRSTITRYDKDNTIISPTESEDIFIGSTAAGNGTLIFNNDAGNTKATVEMYSTADADTENYSAAASTWQYIGTPHSDVQNAVTNYYNSWLYQYNSTRESWDVIPNGGPLEPFRGYCITHPETPHTYTMTGTLTATTSHSAEIPAGKYVVIANSWTAPIQVANFEDDDLENLTDKTVYLFNTGSDPEGEGTITPDASATAETRYAAGTYISIPIHAASYTGDATISSMQGFYVVGGSSEGAVHLDYDKLVRPKEGQSIVGPPMHAPKRIAAQDDEPLVLKMIARGSKYDDNLFVLERPDFTRTYDSGWDGEEWGGNDAAPMLYIVNENNVDETVSAIPDMEGTVISFRAGEDSEYTFQFDFDDMAEALYLLDIDTQIYTRILKGNTYTFTCADKKPHNRFILTRKAPQIATGVDNSNAGEGAKAVKFIKDEKMFIFMNGVLYDGLGKMVVKH